MMQLQRRTNTNDSRLRNRGLYRVLAALITAAILLSSLSYVVPAANAASFSFNAVGDIGATSWGTDPQLRAIPSDGTSFSIFLGDLSYSTIKPESAWCQWVKDRAGVTYPIELISGNHEDNGPDGLIDNFAECLPHRLDSSITGTYAKEYYFDYPSTSPLARFILISPGLDFTNGGSYRYKDNNAHYTWVANAIDDARARNIAWVIVGYHKTCITTGQKSCTDNSDLFQIYQLLLTKKVDLILHGHDHNYQRTKQLSCVTADSFTSSCVVGDGSSGSYSKGLGSVSVIVGTGGQGNYQVNAADSEAAYFAKINGDSNTIGHLVVTVSPDRLDARYNSVLNTFTDSFSIAAPVTSTTTATGEIQISLTPTSIGTHSVPEGSGIVPSRVHPNVYWMIPDSGNPATLYAVDGSGKTVKTFTVSGTTNNDWEDIASDEANNIWIADIGDNSASRSSYILYRFSEPNPFGTATSVTATAYRYIYPDGSKDAEAAFVWQGIPYIVHKTNSNTAKIYKFPELNPAITVTLTNIAQFNNAGRYITGADISTDGRRLALASTSYTFGATAVADYHWIIGRSATSTNIADFFTSPTRVWRIAFNNNGAEAIGFDVNKYDFVVTNEPGNMWRVFSNQYETGTSLPPPTTTLSTFDSSLTQGVAKSASGTSSSSTTWEVPVPYSADQSKTLWQISPNPWAVTSSTSGSVSVQYTAKGSVVIRNTLQGIKGSFGGYPEIIYGRSPWGAIAAGQPPIFPIQLGNMSELITDVSYNLAVTQMAGNIAYDLFLTSVANTNDNTGATEVMVWLWKKDIVTGGNLAESITVPITVNGSPFQAKFNVWTGAAGGNAATVWFLLDDTHMIQSGNIKLSLSFFAKDALQRLGKSLDLYLQGVEFGTEFTQANQDYTFTITKFNVEQTLGSSTTPTLPTITLTASPTSVLADGISKSTITAQLSDNKASVAVSFVTTLGTLAQCVTGTGGSCTTTITSPTAGTATITGSASGYTFGSTSVTFTTSTLPAPSAILTTLDSDLKRGMRVSASGTSTSSTTWSVPVRDSTDQSKILWRIDPSPWAVDSSTSGQVSISYTSDGSVVTRNTLKGITGPFGGYPKIQYGRNPWGDIADGQPPFFPMKIRNMSELTSEASYSLSFAQMTGNIMYDLWLTDVPNTVDNSGATEIMIRFWQNMGTPDGLSGSINVPSEINGLSSQIKFNVYIGTTFSTPGGRVIAYQPDAGQMIQSGSVKLDLLVFITDAIQRLGKTSDSYLQGVEFGTEFTEADQDYTFTITRFNIQQTIGSSTITTPPKITLTASPISVPADGTSKSTITAQLSDNKSSVTISFATTLGILSLAQCVTGTGGICTTTITSPIGGTATITGSASGYTSGGTSVTFTTPPCTRTNPTVILSPSSQTGILGSAFSYDISVKNNDANCGTEPFTLSASSCSLSLTCTLASTSLSIGSGSSGSTTLTVTSLLAALGGTYTVSVKATGPSGLAGEGSASVILSTLPQPSVFYTLKFEGYDLDNPNEVTVLLNGKVVATLPAKANATNDDAWILVSLDITSFIVSGENTLTFQHRNGGALLAVRNVSIVDSNGAAIFADDATRTIVHSSGKSKPSTTYTFTV